MSVRRPELKQVFLLLSFALGLFILFGFGNPRHEHWLLFALAGAVLGFLPYQNMKVVAALSLVVHFIPDPVSRGLFLLLQPEGAPEISNFSWYHAGAILACLLVSYFCLRFLRPRLTQLPGGHFLFLLSYLGLLAVVRLLPTSALQAALQYGVLQFIRFIWPLTHLMLVPPSKKDTLWITTGLLAPFWGFMVYYLPIPLSPVLLRAYRQDTMEGRRASQISGVKMLYLSLGMFALHNFLQTVLYGVPSVIVPFVEQTHLDVLRFSLHLPDVYRNFAGFSQMSLSPLEKFAAIWGKDILFILELFPNFGVVIALGRFCGFRLPRMIYRPLQATSFVQYMGNFLFYYQQLIVRLFFEPCLQFLKKRGGWIRQKSLRISIFLAVLGGGVLFHLVRDGARLVASKNAVGFSSSYFQIVPYFAGIAALAALSNRRPLPLPALLRAVLFFLIHPLVVFAVMSVTRFQSDLEGYFRFILGLLGL